MGTHKGQRTRKSEEAHLQDVKRELRSESKNGQFSFRAQYQLFRGGVVYLAHPVSAKCVPLQLKVTERAGEVRKKSPGALAGAGEMEGNTVSACPVKQRVLNTNRCLKYRIGNRSFGCSGSREPRAVEAVLSASARGHCSTGHALAINPPLTLPSFAPVPR